MAKDKTHMLGVIGNHTVKCSVADLVISRMALGLIIYFIARKEGKVKAEIEKGVRRWHSSLELMRREAFKK